MISMNCRPPRAIDAASAGDVAGREGADPEQAEVEHRLGDPLLDQDEGDEQQRRRRAGRAETAGFVQPMVCPPYGWIP